MAMSDMSNKKSKLSKLKMPPKREDDMDLSDLDEKSDYPMEGDESESAAEGSDQEEGSESPAEESKELSQLSDEELMAELKKRGLMSDMGHESSDEEPMA